MLGAVQVPPELCPPAAGPWLVMYRLSTNLAVGVRKRSMAIPAVGKQHTDDAIDKACSDVGDVMHSPVQARESNQQWRDEAEKHHGPPQPRPRDMECQEGEGEMWSARKAKARYSAVDAPTCPLG